MVAGRPTDYNDECLAKAIEYVQGGWRENGRVIPSLVGLAQYIGRGKTTLYTWKNDKNPDKDKFRDILLQIEEIQHEELLNNGLSGKFNSTISKLVLTKHGYSDKQEVDQTVKSDVTVKADVKQITAEMDAKTATELYQDMMKGD